MANIGYIRVSIYEQNPTKQLENVNLKKIFQEKVVSTGKRPVLAECLNYLRDGDTLHVHSIDRLARNLLELQKIVNELNAKGVIVHFHAENLIFSNSESGKPSPMQELLFQILGAFAQFERNLIKERQREGILKAQQEGRNLGRPPKISPELRAELKEKLKNGASPTELAKENNLSLSSIYKL